MYTPGYRILWAVYILVCASDTFALDINLYSKTPYDSLSQFKDNAERYADSLPFYFKNELAEQFSKVDSNVDYRGTVELGFGAGPQRFVMLLDTSFSGFWVLSSECSLSLACYNRVNLYNKDKSVDYAADILNNELQKRTIAFGETNFLKTSNVLYGELGYDTLTVGTEQVFGQHFLAATSLSKTPFADGFFPDGVFGLGFPSSFLKMEPPFHTMVDRGIVDKPVFSLYVGKQGETGELRLGDLDSDYYLQNTLQYHPVEFFNMTRKTWSVRASMISMQSENLCPADCQAMVDSGSALIVVPPSSLRTIHNFLGLPYSRVATSVDCSKRLSMPNLDIRIGEKYFLLSGYDYTIQIGDECVLGLMEGPMESLWILGNLFLSKTYTVFDLGQMKIGFANLASPNSLKKLKKS